MYSGVVIQNLKCDVLQNVSDVFSVGRVVGVWSQWFTKFGACVGVSSLPDGRRTKLPHSTVAL